MMVHGPRARAIFCSAFWKFFCWIALAAASLAAASCYRAAQTPPSVQAPENGALGWYPRYAVVQEPYLRVFSDQRESASVRSFMRRGDIAEILEISGADEDGYIWYRVALVAPKAPSSTEAARENTTTRASNTKAAKVNTADDTEASVQGWILSRGAVRVQSMEHARFLSKTFASQQGLRAASAAAGNAENRQ